MSKTPVEKTAEYSKILYLITLEKGLTVNELREKFKLKSIQVAGHKLKRITEVADGAITLQKGEGRKPNIYTLNKEYIGYEYLKALSKQQYEKYNLKLIFDSLWFILLNISYEKYNDTRLLPEQLLITDIELSVVPELTILANKTMKKALELDK